MTTNSLPRIVRFLETSDEPESECPHCGATGRFVYNFVVEGGQIRGAMRGCLKLFPVSPIANEELRLKMKQEQYFKKGWQLNRNDRDALSAIDNFYNGNIDERHAMHVVTCAKKANSAKFKQRR